MAAAAVYIISLTSTYTRESVIGIRRSYELFVNAFNYIYLLETIMR